MKVNLIAYLTNEYLSLDTILGMHDESDAISNLTFYNKDMTQHGWVNVGTADIEVTFITREEALQNQVESLKAKKASIIAEATEKATEIDERIQSLLALPAPPLTQQDTSDIIDDDFPF